MQIMTFEKNDFYFIKIIILVYRINTMNPGEEQYVCIEINPVEEQSVSIKDMFNNTPMGSHFLAMLCNSFYKFYKTIPYCRCGSDNDLCNSTYTLIFFNLLANKLQISVDRILMWEKIK